MNRRNLIAMSVALPMLASQRALACSTPVASLHSAAIRMERVRMMFEAWRRDRAAFQQVFTDPINGAGHPLKIDGTEDAPSMPEDALNMFHRYFTNREESRRITLMVDTAAGLLIGCAETTHTRPPAPSCDGMPELHLFLITMRGANPQGITHLSMQSTYQPGKFSVWTEG